MSEQRTLYFPLGGGLDLITPAIALKAGVAIGALNYEPYPNGYRRIEGFERFDGRTKPSEASYWQLDFTAGSAAFLKGDVVTGLTSGATGKVLADATVTSGTYATLDAAGYVGLGAVSGTFANGEALQVSAVTRATASGAASEGTSPTDADAAAWRAQATANARALIQALPGTGSVRGVHEYGGAIYGFRDFSPEQVKNGTFTTDTANWTGSANAILSAPSGVLRVTNGTATVNYAYQAIAVEVGKEYDLSFDQLGGSVPTAFRCGNSANAIQYVNNTTVGAGQTVRITPTASTIYITCRVNSTTNGGYVEFDNISLKPVVATQCGMWKSSTAGWASVALGFTLDFTSGGTVVPAVGDTITGATSGATAVLTNVVVTSGDWTTGDAAGYFVMASATGTFGAENLNIGASLNVATIAGNKAAITLPVGGRYECLNHNFYGASELKRMYGVNGVGRGFEFDGAVFTPIRTGMTVDTPTRVAVHKKHLFFAFPGGSIQFSETGYPLGWEVIEGAGEFGMGDEITDFIPANSGVLTILAANSIANLYGNTRDDFLLEVLSDEAGALPWTADKVGEPIYMDKRGVRRLSSTQAFGNFSIGTLTQKVKPLLQDYAKANVDPVASVRVRNKDQYRIFFSNNAGLTIYLGKKEPEILPFDLNKTVACIGSFEMEDGEEIYFGSDDGFVYQLDKGTSFDGAAIPYSLRLPFNHQGAPQQLKRWHKVVIECEAIPEATLSVTADFDYGNPYQPGITGVDAPAQVFTVTGGGGIWDVSNWNQFYWSGATEGLAEAHLDGVGRNMSLMVAGSTADEPPHLLQGLTLFFTVRGLQR